MIKNRELVELLEELLEEAKKEHTIEDRYDCLCGSIEDIIVEYRYKKEEE